MRILQILEVWLITITTANSFTTSSLLNSPTPYQFGYTVNARETGDFKTHREVSDGRQVRGEYSVGEPNGDLRVVSYTADRANGFRAQVKVHPGASPVAPATDALHSTSPDPVQESSSTTALPQLTRNNASSGTTQLGRKENHTEPKPKTVENHSESVLNSTKNNKTDTGEENKVKIGSLFDVLPGLDKHVPKIEYIVEDNFGSPDGKPFYFRSSSFESSEKPQIIPIEIQEDPYDRSPQLIKADPNIKISTYRPLSETVIRGENPKVIEQGSVKFSHDPQSDYKTSEENLQSQVMSYSSTTMPDIKNFNKDVVLIGSKPNINYNSTGNENANRQPLRNTIRDQLIINTNHKGTASPGYYRAAERPVPPTWQNYRQNGMNSYTNNIQQVTPFLIRSTNSEATQLMPNENIMLAALLLPTSTVLKFTCVPEGTTKDGITSPPPLPTLNEENFMQKTQGTANLPFITATLPLYPFQLVNFNTFKNTDMTFKPFALPPSTTQTPMISPIDKQTTRVPQRVFTSPTAFTSSVPTLPTRPTEEVPSTQKPPVGYTGLRSEGKNYRGADGNRRYPLYPIPPPWMYHPDRAAHAHRHLPIFVLPMSHNLNFAPTFNPQLYDKHDS